jgi:hypothetical protein
MITQRRTSITFTPQEVVILAVKDYHGLVVSLPASYSGGPSLKYRPSVLDVLDEDFIILLGPSMQTFGHFLKQAMTISFRSFSSL